MDGLDPSVKQAASREVAESLRQNALDLLAGAIVDVAYINQTLLNARRTTGNARWFVAKSNVAMAVAYLQRAVKDLEDMA